MGLKTRSKIVVNQTRAADKIRLYITRLTSPKPLNSLIPLCFLFVFLLDRPFGLFYTRPVSKDILIKLPYRAYGVKPAKHENAQGGRPEVKTDSVWQTESV